MSYRKTKCSIQRIIDETSGLICTTTLTMIWLVLQYDLMFMIVLQAYEHRGTMVSYYWLKTSAACNILELF